jgi:hypothetical protein
MALKRIIKFTERVQEFSKKASNTGDVAIYSSLVAGIKRGLVERLQMGIDKGYNIDGQPFKKSDPSPTNPVTRAIRDSKLKPGQHSGTPILYGRGKLRDSFKLEHRGKLGEAEIILLKDPIYQKYGKHHNSGFTQDNENQLFPGSTVPARKYWGIPKSWQSPNGSTYKKIMAKFVSDMDFLFKTYLDKGTIDPTLVKRFEDEIGKNITLYR